MSAFNVVRFRVKPGCEERFIACHRQAEVNLPGLERAVLIKTGERCYCFIAQWHAMNDIINARERMLAILDSFRDTLEELTPELGVTDPVSGEAVVELK